MFNMHPQNISTEDLIDFLTYFYPEDAYVQELCRRADSWLETVEDLESVVEELKEKQGD